MAMLTKERLVLNWVDRYLHLEDLARKTRIVEDVEYEDVID